LIGAFRKKIANYTEVAAGSCLRSISELYHQALPTRPPAVGPSDRLTIYLAAPHKNIAKNYKLKAALTRAGFVVKLPYEEVVTSGRQHGGADPATIRSVCIAAIDESDVLIVDLDTYGLDTAWEIGYGEGTGKKVIGYNEDIFLTTDERHINRRLFRENFMHGWESQAVCSDAEQVLEAVRGKRVYMCGPFSHAPIDQRTGELLAKSAAMMINPKDYLAQQKALPRDYPLADRGETNSLLKEADLLLVFLPRYGMDSAWQIGYAAALGKEIVGWVRQDDGREFARQSFWDHWMHAWKSKPHVVGVTDLLALATGIATQKKDRV
jgi:nucleoside 2-deoxyribosyltransferase